MEHTMELEVTALQGTSMAVSQQNEKTAEHLTLSGKHRSAMNWLASFTHDSRALGEQKHGRLCLSNYLCGMIMDHIYIYNIHIYIYDHG